MATTQNSTALPPTVPSATRQKRLPLTVWLLGAVAFIMGTTEMIVAGLLPQVSDALDVSVGQAGLLITVFAIGMMIGAPVMALATMKLPRKNTLIFALIVFAAAHVLAATSDDFGILLVARFIAAVATGTFWAIGAVVAAAAAGPQAGAKAMGIMIGGVTLANVLGVPLGTAAGQVMGWQGPFWVLAVLAVAAAVLLRSKLPADSTARTGANLRAEFSSLRNTRLWVVYLATALVQASFVAVYSYISPLLTDRAGLPVAAVPLVMVGYGIGALTGTTLGGRFGDRKPFVLLVPATILLSATLVAILLWGSNAPVVIGLFVLLGLFGLVGNPILVAETVRVAGTSGALPMAMSTSWFNVGIATGSWAGGIALTSSIGAQGPAMVGLIIALIALIPVIILASTKHRTTTTATNRVSST
jgi:predicted MFS family arabinose efflux permease